MRSLTTLYPSSLSPRSLAHRLKSSIRASDRFETISGGWSSAITWWAAAQSLRAHHVLLLEVESKVSGHSSTHRSETDQSELVLKVSSACKVTGLSSAHMSGRRSGRPTRSASLLIEPRIEDIPRERNCRVLIDDPLLVSHVESSADFLYGWCLLAGHYGVCCI